MTKLEKAIINIKHLDELALKDSPIHRLSPVAKLLTAMLYIITVTSFPKYNLVGLFPLVLYPIVSASLGDIPTGFILKRVAVVAPFAFLIGIFNPLIDRTPLWQLGEIIITGGWVSFISIMVRFFLTVSTALILIATTGMNEIGAALTGLRFPRVLVVQLIFVYRYLSVLLEESARVVRAYSLRDVRSRGIKFQAWGSLLGQLLMRTIERAQRIYQAMLCRGFQGDFPLRKEKRFDLTDLLYCLCWAIFFITVRLYNVPELLGRIVTGVGR